MLEGSYGLYKDMYTFDKQKLDLVYKDLYELKKDRSLSKTAFAKAIVSMVQKIPYSLAVQGSCSLAYSTNNDVKEPITAPDFPLTNSGTSGFFF